ncbi:MAG: hypothetical protein LBN08_06030 [Lactobacillales bacterium]|jgi:hypothetical protein|nr:hypothetical protein [Lactobacillales bacterium]
MEKLGKIISGLFLTICLVVILGALGLIGYKFYEDNEAQKEQKIVMHELDDLSKISDSTAKLEEEESGGFLDDTFDSSWVTELEKKLSASRADIDEITNKKVDKKEYYQFYKSIKKELDAMKNKLAAQEAVNKLFDAPFLVGTKENNDVIISFKVSQEEFEAVKKDYYKPDSDNLFQISLNKGIELAGKQFEAQRDAEEKVSALIGEGKIAEPVDRVAYLLAQTAVKQVKNKYTRDSLEQTLADVGQVMHDEDAKEEETQNTDDSAAQ